MIKQFPLMFMIFCWLPLQSEPIGDFAPLASGNVWVYDDVRSNGVMSVGISIDSTITIITLKESVQKGDTTYHYFTINSTTTHHYSRLVKSKNTPITANTSSSSSDAVITEVTTIIVAQSGWSVFAPVFNRHFIDTNDTTFPLGEIDFKIYQLKSVNGINEYSICTPSRMVSGATTPSIIYTYRQDVGFVYYSTYNSSNPGVSTSSQRIVQLRSFSGASSNTTALVPSRTVIVQPQLKTIKTLGFPHLFIVKEGKQLNLLGRVDRKSTGIIQPRLQSYQK